MVNPSNLRGVCKIGFEYVNPSQEMRREVDPAFYEFDSKQIASWGCNFVRVPFNSYWYMNDATYRTLLRQWVDALANEGLYVIMDLHSYGSPPKQGPYAGEGWTEATARNLFNTDHLPTLEQVASDYLDQPKVIGVEMNEFWPLDDRSASWLLELELGNTLAQAVHDINPNLLVFIDVYSEWTSDDAIASGVSLITEPNIVFAPHFYCAEVDALILHPTQPGKYGADDGWDFYYRYADGNLAEGKAKMYHWLDLYKKAIQDIYHVPFIITEFATSSDSNMVQALRDMMQYFLDKGWGYNYFGYYGDDAPTLHLLYGDWETLMPQGEAFVEILPTPTSPLGWLLLAGIGALLWFKRGKSKRRG